MNNVQPQWEPYSGWCGSLPARLLAGDTPPPTPVRHPVAAAKRYTWAARYAHRKASRVGPSIVATVQPV